MLAGGLLQDDWVTPDEFKLALLAYVNPTPSLLLVDSSGRLVVDNTQPHPPPPGFLQGMQEFGGAAPAAAPAHSPAAEQRSSEVHLVTVRTAQDTHSALPAWLSDICKTWAWGNHGAVPAWCTLRFRST